jgi:metal-sulfur cluster biosynthetic enzyme
MTLRADISDAAISILGRVYDPRIGEEERIYLDRVYDPRIGEDGHGIGDRDRTYEME